MTQMIARWVLLLGLLVSVPLIGPLSVPSRAETVQTAQSGSEVATVEQLRAEAFKALRQGDFDRTSQLLRDAASRSSDPSLQQMSEWLGQFQSQRHEFVADRRKQFEKAVADVKLLLNSGKESFAIDKAKDAYLLADDKDAFVNDPWMKDLIARTVAMARQCEEQSQWYRALRLYADLSAVEPAKPEWKEKLKVATRRMRLLAVYAPDQFRQIQEAEVKEREAVDALLAPASQPATKPLADENDSFRIDWNDQLKGVDRHMLLEALIQARANYWKDVTARELLEGGLQGLHTLATTDGLEKTFPTLADDQKRDGFLKAIDHLLKDVANRRAPSEQSLISHVVAQLFLQNRDTISLPEKVLVNEFADGAFAELDPFTSAIWPADLEEFNKSTQGEFSGVGIQIQLDDEGQLKVVSPLEDSPAYKLGIKAGDIITRINGKSAKGITINQAVKNITGPDGTSVTLTIRSPDGTNKDYTIRREKIKVASIKGWQHLPGGGWDYFVDSDQRIGYLRLTNFTKTTSEELDRAMSDLTAQGVRGMILDLRYNPGGLLSAATEVSDKFLRDGTIVSTKAERNNGPVQPPIEARASADDVDVPLVVLVNQYSASASEIVSGALKDQKRALVVGERTFGKGSVQMLFPLNNRTAYLKLTTSHYYLPSDRCIHREENSTEWGVEPDVTIEMTPKQMSDAIEARQELDILRAAGENAPVTTPVAGAGKKDLLGRDPQLSAALLLLRLQLAGATL